MTVVGLEHEFIVRRGDDTVDFRSLLHQLAVAGRRIDPGDPHAYRLVTGAALTCDGAEAEIATPPIDLVPGFTASLDRWVTSGASNLLDLLGADYDLEGVSTHISVQIPNDRAVAVAALFARHFVVPLMLVGDRADSPGLLVRPRHQRVELGLDYTRGPYRAAAAAVAAGGVLACDRYLRDRKATRLPSPVYARIEPARSRWGWYVDRSAFGSDLYVSGRMTRLRTAHLRRSRLGQDVLEHGWRCARSALESRVSDADLQAADSAVSARIGLPCEADQVRSPERSHHAIARTPWGLALDEVSRPGFTVNALLATWDYTVFEVSGPRAVYVNVPSIELGEFLASLRSGDLDRVLRAELAGPPRNRVLRTYPQTVERAVFDSVEATTALAAPERGVTASPTTAALAATDATATRPLKGVLASRPSDYIPPSGGRKWWWLALIALVVVVVGAVAAFSIGGDDGTDTASAVTTTTATAVTELVTTTVATTTAAPTTAAPPTTAAATTTLPPLPTAVIRTTFAVPVTNYSVVVNGAAAASFTYDWQLIGNETAGCLALLTVNGDGASWNHPHPPCAVGNDHAGTVMQVTATNPSFRIVCRYQGAAAGETSCTTTRVQ